MHILSLLKLLRIKDWLKNFILFCPLIFTGYLYQFNHYIPLIIGFFFFSIFSSLVYIINDLNDLKEDRLHITKKYVKPLANKEISIQFALIVIFIIFSILLFNIFINFDYFKIPITYFLTSIFYIFFVRKIPYLDIIIISFGYNLRVMFGSFLIDVQTSIIMHLTIFSLALFIISLKRLKEINIISSARKSLSLYKKSYINYINIFCIFSTFFLYLIYVFDKKLDLILSTPFVVISLLRFRFISIKKQEDENPIDIFFSDRLIIISSILYLIVLLFVYK